MTEVTPESRTRRVVRRLNVYKNGNIGAGLTLRDENNAQISRLSLYRRKGLLLQGKNKERKEKNAKSSLLGELEEHIPVLGDIDSRSHLTNEKAQIKVENLILELFPDTEWAMYIKQMEQFVDNIHFSSMSLEMYRSIFWILTSPKTEVLSLQSAKDADKLVVARDRSGQKVKGRGNGYKSMCRVVSCIKRMHYEAEIACPSELAEGKQLLASMQKKYVPKGAPTVDPCILLPRMYESIHFTAMYYNGNKLCSSLRVTRDWVMFLMTWIMFARPSEIFHFCPSVESISIPMGVRVDRDGLPPFLLMDLLQWKNRAISKGQYQIRIVRNYLNAKFCPVFWILYWLSISSLRCGPIVTKLISKDKAVPVSTRRVMTDKAMFVYEDDNHKTTAITQPIMEKVFLKAFKSCGYPSATMYTIRKTATMWGARCGAKQYSLLATGRWRSASNHFQSYVKAGCSDADRFDDKSMDPVRKIWVYHENVESINAKPVDVTQHVVEQTPPSKKRKRNNQVNDDEEDEADCDDEEENDEDYCLEQYLQFESIPKSNDLYMDYLPQGVCDLIKNFKAEFVKANERPDEARQRFERSMDKYGILKSIDMHGLLAQHGHNHTVRPPYDEITVYKHITENKVLHAYGISKHRLDNHPSWVKVNTVLSLGLSEESDDLEGIFQDDSQSVAGLSRVVPTSSKEMCGFTFRNKQAIIELFNDGDDKYLPARDWLESICDKNTNLSTKTEKEYRTFKQNYSGLCLEYIYAKKCEGSFLRLKKERVQAGTNWLKTNLSEEEYKSKTFVKHAMLY